MTSPKKELCPFFNSFLSKPNQSQFRTGFGGSRATIETLTHMCEYLADSLVLWKWLLHDFYDTKTGGRKTITVYCQVGDAPTVESGRMVASKDPVMKCFVTDGSDASLTGQVVIFFKVRAAFQRGRVKQVDYIRI